MMDPNLIIDDDYVYGVGSNCESRGKKLEEILDSYRTILNEIKDEALLEGGVSEALESFIECVTLLNDQLTTLSQKVDDTGMSFIQDINTADNYLF